MIDGEVRGNTPSLPNDLKKGDRDVIKVEAQQTLKSVLDGKVLTFYVQKGFDYCMCNIINKSGSH